MTALLLMSMIAVLPTYPGAALTPIGTDSQLAYFVTTDSLEAVGRYFLQCWSLVGYPTSAVGDFQQEGVVSAFLTRSGEMLSVVLSRTGDRTLGFVVWGDAPEEVARARDAAR